MIWNDIPTLASLRAFEAAARLGSLTAAAAELNVTHAAVAQHVRSVEAHLQTSLMVREGRGMALTEAGARLAGDLGEGFARIVAGVHALQDTAKRRPLAVTVTPSFAENWLMPRLPDFWRQFPDLMVSLTPSVGLSDLRRDGLDLGVRFGNGDWPGLEARLLLPADFSIVAAPSLIGGTTPSSMAEVADLPWVFDDLHRETQTLAKSAGLNIADANVRTVPSGGLAMAAVRSGAAISILSRALIGQDVKDGRMVRLLDIDRPGVGYWIVHPKGTVTANAKTFMRWLKGQARQDG